MHIRYWLFKKDSTSLYNYRLTDKTVQRTKLFNGHLPSSLSLRSEQSCSRWMSHPGPNHPDSHQHSHSMLWLVLHWPWALQLPGQPSSVQCFPFQPVRTRKNDLIITFSHLYQGWEKIKMSVIILNRHFLKHGKQVRNQFPIRSPPYPQTGR